MSFFDKVGDVLGYGLGKNIWNSLTGKKYQDRANELLQQSIDLTKQTTGKIDARYNDLLNIFNSSGGIGKYLGNLNNVGNNILGAISQYQGPDSRFVQSQQAEVNKAFDTVAQNQDALLTNKGFNPNDSAYNGANAELANQRASALANVSNQANQQAFNNYLTGLGQYGGLNQSLLNTGLGINNAWANALSNSLNANIGANNAMGAFNANRAGNTLQTIGGLANIGASIGKLFVGAGA